MPVVIVKRWWRVGAAVLVVLFVLVQTWQCMNLYQWWSKPVRFEIAPRILAVGKQMNDHDAVIYCPGSNELLGRYLGVPAHKSAMRKIWDYHFVKDGAHLPEDYQAPATWVVDHTWSAPIHRR